jgi:hypothetical protein
MGERDVAWLDLYRFAWAAILGEEVRIMGSRCTLSITWLDEPPMPADQLRDFAERLRAQRESA